MHATGLDTAMAVTAAGFIQPGRISKCYKAWKIVTKDKKVLSIVADGNLKVDLPPHHIMVLILLAMMRLKPSLT